MSESEEAFVSFSISTRPIVVFHYMLLVYNSYFCLLIFLTIPLSSSEEEPFHSSKLHRVKALLPIVKALE